METTKQTVFTRGAKVSYSFETPQSSNIARVAWEGTPSESGPQTELRVTFKHGGTYAYPGAPFQLYLDFKAAPSKGQFFAQRVRKQFQGVKLG